MDTCVPASVDADDDDMMWVTRRLALWQVAGTQQEG